MSGFKTRSVGDVPAPTINMKDAIEGAIPVLRKAVIEGEKLGRDAERAAVVKYLRLLAKSFDNGGHSALLQAAFDLEHGAHVK